MATMDELKPAIESKDMVEIRRILAETPALINAPIKSSRPGNTSVLGRAVEMGYLELAQELINVHSVDPNAVDEQGNPPLLGLAGCQKSSDPTVDVDPSDVIDFLLQKGADLSAANALGQNAVHMAAKHGRIASLDQMTANPNFAAANRADVMEWTPMDMAGGAGQAEVEDYLVRNNLADAPPLVQPDHPGGLTTVEVLCMATKIVPKLQEDDDTMADALARDQEKARDRFTELYKRPEFRPMLDLAARDAVGSRDQNPGPQALRIYMDFTSDAASGISTKGGYGAFDPDGNTLVLGAEKGARTLEGTIIHEMTHHAANMVYGNSAVPFNEEGDATATAYFQAIQDDARTAHRNVAGERREVADTVTGRIYDYTARGGDSQKKRNAALQEFLVGIPQAIHEHGANVVGAVSPQMLNFFQATFSTAAAGVPDPANVTANILNGNAAFIAGLQPLPPDPPPPAETWMDMSAKPMGTSDKIGTRRGMMQMVMMEYRGRSPNIRGGDIGLVPPGSTLPPLAHGIGAFLVDEDFEARGDDGASMDALRRTVSRAIEPLLSEMPAEIRNDRLVGFATAASTHCGAGKSADQMTKDIAHEARDMVREAKFEYIAHREQQGADDEELLQLLADAITFDAACMVLDATNRDGSVIPEMKASELQALKTTLKDEISTSGKVSAVAQNPANAKQMATTLAGSEAMKPRTPGFLKRLVRAIPVGDQKKVKSSSKKARNIWTAQLAGF